jgi:DNA-binding NarL/FixJ family response regulator
VSQMYRLAVASLTPRETDVFDLLVRGNRNKPIADALGVSERTIKAHRKQIMVKLGVSSLAECVSIAERLGLIADWPVQR